MLLSFGLNFVFPSFVLAVAKGEGKGRIYQVIQDINTIFDELI